MTRETKIGLLVGLAFIIVIGILLSDHLTSTTEPPQATLASAGSTVRQAINTPGGAGTGAPVTVVTPLITPQQTVATQGELTPAAQAVKIVRIGGPTESPAPVSSKAAVDAKTENPVAKADTDQTEANKTDTDSTAVDPALAKAAAANGEALVPVGTKSKSLAGTTYVAQSGDSVSKIASKLLGSASKANIAAFVKANPSLDGDPANLQAGRTYKIPATATDPTDAAAGASVDAPTNAPLAIAANSDADDAIKTATSAKTAGDTIYLYTVKPGDNLTKIARDQLGDMHAVASIQELNTDRLKGAKHDVVLVGMKLRLPGKPVAKAD
jgi:LysM repeat protein